MMFRAPLNTRRFSLLRSGLNLGFSLVCLAFTSNSHAITVGTYEISAEHSGKCLDVTEWSTQNGTGLQQWSCDSGANQRFELESQGNGFYRIRSVHSGKCVDVAERSNNNGALIQQWDCHSGSNQKFKFKLLGGTTPPPQPQAVWKENFEGISTGSRWLDRAYTEVKSGCGVNGSRCVRVTYVPSSEGSPRIVARKSLPTAKEYTLNYDVMFENGWDFVKGGKLPGLGPDKVIAGCMANQADGWSARVMWRRSGTPVIYSYHQNRANRCGDDFYSSDQFAIGRYQAVSLHVKVNDPWVANGLIELYLDGRKIAEHQNAQLRNASGGSTQITQFLFDTFFGGSDSSWSPPRTVYSRFDNFAVYPGLRVRNRPGE